MRFRIKSVVPIFWLDVGNLVKFSIEIWNLPANFFVASMFSTNIQSWSLFHIYEINYDRYQNISISAYHLIRQQWRISMSSVGIRISHEI